MKHYCPVERNFVLKEHWSWA